MVYKVVFALLVVCCSIGVRAQQCIPNPVTNIQLNKTSLTWDASDNCNTTHYIVNIHSAGVLEYVYQVDNNSLNVTFLSYCRSYTFSVTAIADHVIGEANEYDSTIPLPEGTNITVSNFTGSQIDRDVLLQWYVPQEYIYCPEYFTLRIWSEGSAVPQQITTSQTGYYIIGVAQCMKFQVELSVTYEMFEEPVAQFNYTVPPTTNVPELKSVRQDAITINTTWALESYSVNRCNVTNLYLNGTHFNMTVPIVDNPQRPTIDVSIPKLRADSMYFFKVSAENEAGISTPYQVAVQTSPIIPDLEYDFENADLASYQ